MQLDIRFPMGLLFVVLGALLAGYGLFTRESPAGPGGDPNLNADWGGILLLFGAAMLLLACRARRGRRGRQLP
jgi:hypothetical protein